MRYLARFSGCFILGFRNVIFLLPLALWLMSLLKVTQKLRHVKYAITVYLVVVVV